MEEIKIYTEEELLEFLEIVEATTKDDSTAQRIRDFMIAKRVWKSQ